MSPLLAAVDLGPLQPVGIVYVHRLPLGIEVDSSLSAFAMSVARGFGAAKGQVNLGANGRSVYISDSGIQIANGAEGFVDVARVDGSRKSVHNAIGNFNGLIKVLAWNHADHGTKNFFLRNAHLRMHVAKDGGLVEPAARVRCAFQAMPAAHHF